MISSVSYGFRGGILCIIRLNFWYLGLETLTDCFMTLTNWNQDDKTSAILNNDFTVFTNKNPVPDGIENEIGNRLILT